jgi:hypothetical protein
LSIKLRTYWTAADRNGKVGISGQEKRGGTGTGPNVGGLQGRDDDADENEMVLPPMAPHVTVTAGDAGAECEGWGALRDLFLFHSFSLASPSPCCSPILSTGTSLYPWSMPPLALQRRLRCCSRRALLIWPRTRFSSSPAPSAGRPLTLPWIDPISIQGAPDILRARGLRSKSGPWRQSGPTALVHHPATLGCGGTIHC